MDVGSDSSRNEGREKGVHTTRLPQVRECMKTEPCHNSSLTESIVTTLYPNKIRYVTVYEKLHY